MSEADGTTPAARSGNYAGVVPILSSGDKEAVGALANDWHTAPEVLFLLSQYPSAEIRKQVAANRSTPEAADEFLLDDASSEVRASLGTKLARLLPELTGDDADRMRDSATAKLLILARDSDVTVRRTLSNEICLLDCIPKELAETLVRDLDTLVSTPIAEFSPLLNDFDLIGLIAEAPGTAVLSAVARRPKLGSSVVDSIVETGDRSLITTLLRNSSAQIREATLEQIIDQADSVVEWHEPLVQRTELTEGLIAKLVYFIGDALVTKLADRHDLSPDVVEDLKSRLVGREPTGGGGLATEAQIVAAARSGQESEVVTAISLLSKIPVRTVRGLFASRMPKSVVALAWKAGLTAQAAAVLQRFPGRIEPKRIIPPEENGSYSASEEEMSQLMSVLAPGNG